MDDIYDRYVHGEMLYADSNKINIGKAYKASNGHLLYGGGGIMPDVFVPIDTGTFLRSVTKLYLDGTFNSFVYTYYINRLPQFSQYSSPADFLKRYNKVNDAWNQLVLYALKDSINLRNTAEKDKVAIQKRLKAYLARYKWRTQGYYQVLNNYDPVVIKAAEVLSKN